MRGLFFILLIFTISMIGTWWVFNKVLKIAILKNIVDNPDDRKLQRQPIPVLGGVAVFFGMSCSLLVSCLVFDCNSLFNIFIAMVIMLYIGTMDDILSLTPKIRFIIEILIVLFFICINDSSIDSFHGLWSIYGLPVYIAIPLTVFASVGIINSINLIDGVNGLSSGFCIITSLLYGIIFYRCQDFAMSALMFSSMGALLPFYFHNVFGKKSKMFIGDGGTLLLGFVFSTAIISILRDNSNFSSFVPTNFGIVAFALASLSIPIFDTLRVMISRIVNHQSPFHPDKTHLHHLLLDFHFSHIGVTLTEIFMNLFIVFIWWILFSLNFSKEIQLYGVILFGILFTFVFYQVMRKIEQKGGHLYSIICRIGQATHFGHSLFYRSIRNFLDNNCHLS